MVLSQLIEDKRFISVISAIGGMLLTIIVNQILNKRGLLTYFVRHSRVGLSTDDVVFGSVRVTWNNNSIANLYSSTVELVNQSMRDYENVSVRAFTSDTLLLTERTEIVDTTQVLSWTEDFVRMLNVASGQQPSQEQFDLHSRQRHYIVPILNRGQVIRLHFLNAASTPNPPSIWMDVLHRGIKLKFSVPRNEVLGVPQPTAAFLGVILGFSFVSILTLFVQTIWIVAFSSLIFGFFAQIPGAYAFKFWRWLRHALGG